MGSQGNQRGQRRTAKEKRAFGPPGDKPWIWATTEMLASPAWKALGLNHRRILDFLAIEHSNHAGRQNGKLIATYQQLFEFGVTRRLISSSLEELEWLGFTRSVRGGRWAGSNQPTKFTLTFYANWEGRPATNEWQGRTEAAIKVWRDDREEMKRRQKAAAETRKKQKLAPLSGSTVVPLRGPTG